jgi:hypothetical protein
MKAVTTLVQTQQSLQAAQGRFEAACADAARILEAQLTEISQQVQTSAGRIASLESDLECYDFFEQERRAASTRLEIASAVSAHTASVDGAKARVRHAWEDYHQRLLTATALVAPGPQH